MAHLNWLTATSSGWEAAGAVVWYLAGWAVIAILAGLIVVVLCRATPPSSPAFEQQPLPTVPWTLYHVGVILVLLVATELVVQMFIPPDRWREHVAVATTVQFLSRGAEGHVGSYAAAASSANELIHYHAWRIEHGWWVAVMTVVARVIQFAVILFVLTRIAGAGLEAIGLTRRRWRENVVAGYWTWLPLAPLAVAISVGLRYVEPRPRHLVETLLYFRVDSLATWAVLVPAVVVILPMVEELFFRGVVQRLMVHLPSIADAVLVATLISFIALSVAEVAYLDQPADWWWAVLLVGSGGGYVLFEKLTRPWLDTPGVARSIYAASLLFACVHGHDWPNPIPLFFLSLGLGFVAYRTQSLVAPIVVHGLFNAMSLTQFGLWRMAMS